MVSNHQFRLRGKTPLVAQVDKAGRFSPLTPSRVGGGFSARQLAVAVTSRSAQPWWQQAGRLDVITKFVRSGGSAFEVVLKSVSVPLGAVPLLIDLGAEPVQVTRLIFAPHRWLPAVTVEVWSL